MWCRVSLPCLRLRGRLRYRGLASGQHAGDSAAGNCELVLVSGTWQATDEVTGASLAGRLERGGEVARSAGVGVTGLHDALLSLFKHNPHAI